MIWIQAAFFVVLAIVSLLTWIRGRNAAATYALITFASIAIVAVIGAIAPSDPDHPSALTWATRILIVILLLFPWALYRMARTFAPRSLRITGILTDAVLAVMVIATLGVPQLATLGPQPPWPVWVYVYVALLAFELLVLALLAAIKIGWNSRGKATVVRSRMRLLAGASALLTAALLVSSLSGQHKSQTSVVVTQLIAMLSALLFILGVAPPRFVRRIWEAPQRALIALAVRDVLLLSSTPAITERFLSPMAEIAGSTTAAFLPDIGEPVLVGLTGREAAAKLAADERKLEFPITDGRIIIWSSELWPFVEDDENIVLYNCAGLLDMWRQRQRREELLELRTRELQQSNEDLRSFAYAASHDLQAPLRTVAGFSEILFPSLDDAQLSPEQRVMVTHMQGAISKMQLLIKDLLNYGRIGSAEAIALPQSLSRAAADVAELMAADFTEAGAVMTVDALDWVLVDYSHVRQLLQNLIQNAIVHASPDRAPALKVTSRKQGERVFVTVSDNGQGIRSEDFERIFEMFKQLQAGPGTGIGLAMVKRILDRYNGSITVESTVGEGSSFTFDLPSADPGSGLSLLTRGE